jgi:predicted ArsR family transcriptional regulator
MSAAEQPTSERLLHLLKSRGPQTVAGAGEALGLSAMATRQQLEALVERGLAQHFDVRRGQAGRPSRHWQLTESGHARFPDRHGELTVKLIADVRALFGSDGLERLIGQRESDSVQSYSAALADATGPGERLARLAALRSAEGYMAEVQAEPDGSWLLAENHCPICAAARSCQGFCRSELAVFRTVLGDGLAVERVDHLLAGARRCAYRITRLDPGGQ